MAIEPFSLERFAPRRPWLVLGKGPSFAVYDAALSRSHDVFALNHAMRGLRAAVGHAVDIEVLDLLSARDLGGIEHLCLPWIPHVREQRAGKAFFGPGSRTLQQCCESSPLLRSFAERGRLLSYNLVTAPLASRNPALPLVEATTFSAAVAVRLLAQSGAHAIRTLGVDGGSAYSAAFADLEARTKLQTGQPGFDAQFAEIAATLNLYQALCGPLDWELPARVLVGCMPEQELAYRVLEYSIRRHASISVQVEQLHEAVERRGIEVPEPRDPARRGRTPFTFQRFAIPALRGHRGRAIYLDSDMLVLRDIRALWGFDLAGNQLVAAPGQFSVMVMDCEALQWDAAELVRGLDAGKYSYEELVHGMAAAARWSPALPRAWNSLEHYDPHSTCLLHFTDMNAQPWLDPLHRYAALWSRYLLEAVDGSFIPEDLVKDEVRAGHVRPSLLAQLERGEPEPRRLPLALLRRDLFEFVPPHRRGRPRPPRMGREITLLKAYFSRW